MPESEVAQEEQSGKTSKTRARSSTRFPVVPLSSAVDAARSMHEKAGGECDRAQLASLLSYSSVRSGAFLGRIAAMKLFKLVEETRERGLYLSALGLAIVAPIDDATREEAQVEAFLGPDLFKSVFDEFYGKTLPLEDGLRNLFETRYGVIKSRAKAAVSVMLKSAQYAGVLTTTAKGNSLVRPLSTRPGGHEEPEPPDEPEAQEGPATPEMAAGNGGGTSLEDSGGSGSIDPTLLALLRKLPPGGTHLTPKRREALVAAFNALIDFIYPGDDDDDY